MDEAEISALTAALLDAEAEFYDDPARLFHQGGQRS